MCGPMHTTTKLMFVLLLASIACKEKSKDNAATAPAAVPVEAGSAAAPAAAPTIAMQAGESLAPNADLTLNGTNPLVWKATPSVTVAVGFVFKGEVARAVAAFGGGAPIELGQVLFNAAYSGEFGATTTSDG